MTHIESETHILRETAEFWKSKQVTVTGGSGFLGNHLVHRLSERGATGIVLPRSQDCDLRLYENCLRICEGKDIVLHLAGNVGGIGYNREHPFELAADNLLMAVNMVRAATECGVKKFIGIGTICEYPKFAKPPFKEEDLWDGYPEETNGPYGMAKKMLLVLGQAARQQHGLKAVHLMPVNLYGPGDNFDPESSHVIPALIRRFVDAKRNNLRQVTVWGTGKATREFLYVEDAAFGICLAAERYDSSEPVNIGAGIEISIKSLAEMIATNVGFEGEIAWDTTKPDGQPRRMLDVSKAAREFGFRAITSFDQGLRKTISWYLKTF